MAPHLALLVIKKTMGGENGSKKEHTSPLKKDTIPP